MVTANPGGGQTFFRILCFNEFFADPSKANEFGSPHRPVSNSFLGPEEFSRNGPTVKRSWKNN